MPNKLTGEVIGVVRSIDFLGRIVVPKEIRTSLGIEPNDRVEMIPYQNGVFIRKVGGNNG